MFYGRRNSLKGVVPAFGTENLGHEFCDTKTFNRMFSRKQEY